MRFPEFEDEWKSFSFRDIVQMFSGGTPSMRSLEYWGGDIPFISAASMHDVFISKSDQYITREGLQNGSKLLKKGNLLLLVRGSMLWNRIPVCYNTIDIAFNQDVKGLVTNDKTSALFMFYWLQSKESILKYKVTGTGIGAGKLDSADILDLLVILPYNTEQSKIEKLLSLIDERITAQSKIIAQLQTLMTGLREQLFKQKIRFKDNNGNDYPDWEEKKLGEVCEIIMGQSPNSSFYNSEKIGLPLIQGNADIENRKTNPRNYTSEITKECKRGDLILTVRAPVGTIAKSVHNACIGRGVCAIRKTKEINIEFIYQFLLDFEPNWIVLEQGSTFTAVSGNEIKNITFFVPHLAEQALIANFLSSIDGKMETEKGILQQYENQKKYLLQNMFI